MANEQIQDANEEGIVHLRDVPAYELRVMMRQHAYIVMACVIAALVAFVLPSDPWFWYIPRLIILAPAAFLGVVRVFMLNGVREELERRARVSRFDGMTDPPKGDDVTPRSGE